MANKIMENGNLKTIGVMLTFLGVVVILIMQITSGSAQEISELQKDVKGTVAAIANSNSKIAVLEEQNKNIQKSLDRIEALQKGKDNDKLGE